MGDTIEHTLDGFDAFEETVERSSDGIAVLDASGRYVFVNHAHAALHGYDDRAAIVGKTWRELHAGDEFGRFTSEILPTLRETGEWRGRVLGRRRGGGTFRGALSLSTLDGGRIVSVVRDVTERVRRRRRLEHLHEASHELLYARVPAEIGTIAVDITRDVLDFDRAGVWRYDGDDEALVPLFRGNDRPDHPDPVFVRPIEDGTPEMDLFRSGETRIVWDYGRLDDRSHPDAPVRTVILAPLGERGLLLGGFESVRTVSAPERARFTTLARYVTIAMDRTAREQAGRDREAALEEENERLEEFAGTLAHDLRNPLSVAEANLDLARETGEDQYFERARRGHERLEALIDDALTLAREGRVVGDREPTPLDEVVAAAWTTGADRNGTLDRRSLGTVDGDRERLRTLFENLFGNAVEHGGDDVTVTVGTTDDGFFVADDGPGIAPAEREQVFDPGYSTEHDGTGYGLHIVRTIAEAHGWSVRVTESAAGGARFEVTGVAVE